VRGQKQLKQRKLLGLGVFLALSVWMVIPGRVTAAQQTTVQVLVKDATTGDPVYQAHLTLKFRKHGGLLRRSEIVSYTAKTDKKGRCRFPLVPMGEITLMVTAPGHDTFGKLFEINKDLQVIEIKLKKPKPQL
jgi:Carboxypeptidase regulatory-like domain